MNSEKSLKHEQNPFRIRVISTMDLDDVIKKKIESFIESKHKKTDNLIFEYELDIGILGGVLIVDGDKYYDGTLKSELIKIKKSLSCD